MAKKKKPEDRPDENQDAFNESEDTFGLPEIEYKPLDELQSTEPAADTPAEPPAEEPVAPRVEERYVYTPPVEEKSKTPLIIGLVIGVVIILAGFLIYTYAIKPAAEKTRLEKLAKQKADAEKAEQERQARLAQEQEEARKKAIADSLAAANAKPAVGAIEVLSERTRRYYVVISSAIDDDLLMDYAKKLSLEGVGTKLIPPFGETKFYRLAISDYDTYATAQSNADASKGKFGNEVWVVRY